MGSNQTGAHEYSTVWNTGEFGQRLNDINKAYGIYTTGSIKDSLKKL